MSLLAVKLRLFKSWRHLQSLGTLTAISSREHGFGFRILRKAG
jgi:hypothetical protein